MRSLLLIAALLFTSFAALADAWDNLTMDQAKKVQKFLTKNPYIIDYCDCCTEADVYLMKVVSTEIIACSWDQSQYSLKANVIRLAKLPNYGDGLNQFNAEKMNETASFTITMNYTFGFYKKLRWAVPLFKLLPYKDNHVCKGATNYPDPITTNKTELDAGYTAWHSKNIEKNQN